MESVKKCSRCRGKRLDETEFELFKYSTCSKCRNKRKIVKQFPALDQQSVEFHTNTFHKFNNYLEILKTNKNTDLSNVKFMESVNDDEFPIYTIMEINQQTNPNEFYSNISKKLIKRYIDPISLVTGYKFPIRDYHKGGIKTKKVSLMFICCQDKTKQRKSRSKQHKRVSNKLKIYNCFSKVNLNYDLLIGGITITYTHKCHANNTVDYDDHSDHSNLRSELHAQIRSDPATHPNDDDLKDPGELDHFNDSIQSIAAAAVENKFINIDDRLINH